MGNTTEGDLKHNATFQSLTNQKKSFISYNIVRGLCCTLSRDEEDDDEEYVSGSLLIRMLICNGDCGVKSQDMQSVNLIRPILQIRRVLRQIFLNAIITRSCARVTIY